MITLDEAIEREKFKARIDRIKANKRIFHNNDKNKINACNRNAEEHEQLAEWLEELKKYKEVGTVEYTMRKSNKQYNKALDDFVKLAKEYVFKYGNKDITHCVIGFIEFFSEQLKECDVK